MLWTDQGNYLRLLYNAVLLEHEKSLFTVTGRIPEAKKRGLAGALEGSHEQRNFC